MPLAPPRRPHVLGIDDGPFDKFGSREVPIVGVTTEGSELVEGVAITRFPVDGDGVTDFLAEWVAGLRMHAALHAVVLGGITIAGLAVVDLRRLAERLGVPVFSVNRRQPGNARLLSALQSAGLPERGALVESAPESQVVAEGLYVATAGAVDLDVAAWMRALCGKSRMPESLRLAHLIARALVTGESRGRP